MSFLNNALIRPLRAAACAACVVLGWGGGGLAQSVEQPLRINIADGPALARQLLDAGQPNAAREVILALLEADPTVSGVHLLHARSLMDTGQTRAAREAARTAWRVASTDRERFRAAFTMADLLAADEAYTRSQLWIRRAVQVAPDDQSAQLAEAGFRRVRQANPLAVELRFGVAPSGNVNSGNSNETITFAYLPGVLSQLEWQVPPDQRPLSGLEVSLQTNLRYRIAEAARSRTSVEVGVYGRTYVMSDEAKASAPDVTGESLSFARLSFGLLHQWVGPSGDQPYSASLTYNYDWTGGQRYRQEWDATIGSQFRLPNEDRLAVSGGVRFSDRVGSLSDVTTYSLRGLWSRDLDNDDLVEITGQVAAATSDVSDQAYDAVTLGVSYDFGDIGAGIDIRTSWTEQYRVYDTSAFDPAGRNDRISTLQLEMGLTDVALYGFEPVMTVTGRRTDSSVPRFDTQGVQIGLNLRSSF